LCQDLRELGTLHHLLDGKLLRHMVISSVDFRMTQKKHRKEGGWGNNILKPGKVVIVKFAVPIQLHITANSI
jgi:adenylylsulfate kinase-like enzyme